MKPAVAIRRRANGVLGDCIAIPSDSRGRRRCDKVIQPLHARVAIRSRDVCGGRCACRAQRNTHHVQRGAVTDRPGERDAVTSKVRLEHGIEAARTNDSGHHSPANCLRKDAGGVRRRY